MARQKVKVDDLTKAVMATLKDFENATDDSIERALKEGSDYALNELHNAHPSGSEKYGKWDEYNKGWTSTKGSRGKKFKYKTIHNKTHYQLTHLLEKGHALVNGGRTRAFPHIKPVEDKTEDIFINAIKKEI